MTSILPLTYWSTYLVSATLLVALGSRLVLKYSFFKCSVVALAVNVLAGLLGYAVCATLLLPTELADPISPNPFGLLLASLSSTATIALVLSIVVWRFIAARQPRKAAVVACICQVLALPVAAGVILAPEHPFVSTQAAVAARRQEYLTERISHATYDLVMAYAKIHMKVPPLSSLAALEPHIQLDVDSNLRESMYIPNYTRFATGDDHSRPVALQFQQVNWNEEVGEAGLSGNTYVVVVDGRTGEPLVHVSTMDVLFGSMLDNRAKRGS